MPSPKLVAAGVTLRDQVNQAFPKRDKRTDGWLGDKSHQARPSDHNPDSQGWVHAIDIDEDFLGPGKGQKLASEFADQLIKLAREGKDGGRLKYVVYENRVASGTYANKYWVWRSGNWGHTAHIHVSFTSKADKDGSKFDLPILNGKEPPKPKPPAIDKKYPGLEFLQAGMKNDHIKMMQKQLIKKGFVIPAGPTSYYGKETIEAVKKFNRSQGWTSDGKKMSKIPWDRLFQ